MSEPNDKQTETQKLLAAAALVGQLGFVIALPVVAGAFIGAYFDKKLGGTGLVVIPFAFLGFAAGIVAAYRLVKRAM